MRRALLLLVVAAVAGCGPAAPFRLAVEQGGGSRRFRLIAAPGVRINARLKPALELEDGTVLRFDSPHVVEQGAYFADAPALETAPPRALHRGVVRASVCATAEQICESFTLAVRF
jgi:hypothetical protein